MRRAMALMMALACLAGLALAAEKAPGEITQDRATSALTEISTKPLYVYTARGRPDPFVNPAGATATARTNLEFSISELRLVGFMEAGGSKVALFRHRHQGTTYTFRQGKLFAPENLPVENVTGKLQKGNEVLLVQGERRVVFNPLNLNK